MRLHLTVRRALAALAVPLAVVAAVAVPSPAQAVGERCSESADSGYNWSQSTCIEIDESAQRMQAETTIAYGGAFNGSHVVSAYWYARLHDATDGSQATLRREVTTEARTKTAATHALGFAPGKPGHFYYVESWLAVSTGSALYNSGTVGRHPFTDQLRW